MEIPLEASYTKKLGLPNFSSHSFTLTTSTKVSDPKKIPAEAKRLYKLLQKAVDEELENVGNMPDPRAYGHPKREPLPVDDGWKCSAGQRALIENLVELYNLSKPDVQELAVNMFGKGVKMLSGPQATLFAQELQKRKEGVPLLEQDSVVELEPPEE